MKNRKGADPGQLPADYLRKKKEARDRRGARFLGIILSALLCLFTASAAISGIFRYASGENAVRSEAEEMRTGDIYIVLDGEEIRFSSFLTAALGDAFEAVGIEKSGAADLVKTEVVSAYLTDVFARAAKEFAGGKELSSASLGDLADRMYEAPDVMKKTCKRALGEEERDAVKRLLSATLVTLSGDDTTTDGRDRAAFLAVISDVFFFASAALAAAFLPAIFVAGNFDAKFYFLYTGISFLAAGLVLLGFNIAAAIKIYGSGLFMTAVLRAALFPFVIVTSSAVALGALFAVVSSLISRARQAKEPAKESY